MKCGQWIKLNRHKSSDKWMTKYNKPKQYVVSAKLDGVSVYMLLKMEKTPLY